MAYRTPRWHIVFGIVISLLLHVAALLYLRLPAPQVVADPRTWLTQVEVRIVPPPPVAQAEPRPEAAATPGRTVAATRPRPRRQAPQPASPAATAGTLVLLPGDPAPGQAFDREAAKAAARDIAGELDTTPLKARATRDDQLARQIQNAARPHCKDGIPGGLLAPLYLLMEKKDSGCKW